MTTTIDLFNFTKPVGDDLVRMMTNDAVYDALATEIMSQMCDGVTDLDNSAYVEVVRGSYFVAVEISFHGRYVPDIQCFEWGNHDFGEWEATDLYDINVIDCHKDYEVCGEAFELELILDTDRIINDINR